MTCCRRLGIYSWCDMPSLDWEPSYVFLILRSGPEGNQLNPRQKPWSRGLDHWWSPSYLLMLSVQLPTVQLTRVGTYLQWIFCFALDDCLWILAILLLRPGKIPWDTHVADVKMSCCLMEVTKSFVARVDACPSFSKGCVAYQQIWWISKITLIQDLLP